VEVRSLEAVTPCERAADTVIRRLQAAGFAAFRVGGCVRDRLLGRCPQDADVATAAHPEQVRTLFDKTFAVGEQFGVIVVHAGRGVDIEVATFRSEAGYSDGRRPDRVRFTGPGEDARRRDFTVNALFYDPVRRELLDYCGGLADLRRGVIRGIGDPAARFREDGLRMLRAVRFMAAFDFELESKTRVALARMRAGLRRISPERIRVELGRTLTGPRPHAGFAILADAGLLEICLPEAALFRGVPQPPEFHPEGDVWEHTLAMLAGLRGASESLAWAALLHDVGKPVVHLRDKRGRDCFPRHAAVGEELAAGILTRLRASRQMRDTVALMVGRHMQFADVRRMRQSTLRRMAGRPTFPAELELHRLDCAASHRRFENYCFLLDLLWQYRHEPIIPPPLLRGRDILALGVAPGRLVGQILEAVEQQRLDGLLTTREEALAWVRARLAGEVAAAGEKPAGGDRSERGET